MLLCMVILESRLARALSWNILTWPTLHIVYFISLFTALPPHQ